jgi:hypothetical protein
MQQCIVEVSLETDIKLKSKEGTHKTSCKIKDDVRCIVPICVTTTDWPFGKLTETS